MTEKPAPKAKSNAARVRMAVDYAAPIVFVAVLLVTKNFQLATWVLVGGSALALLIGWIAERRLAPLPLVAGLAAMVFGGMTLIFHNNAFVKMKLTVVDSALAIGLLGGIAMGKNPLKKLLGEAVSLPDTAWRNLTVRYALFFLACAVCNELVWRTQSDARWAVFRLMILGAALVFSLLQTPFIMKHMINDEGDATPPPPDPGF
jgi:intracellular septation protein